MDSPDDGWVGGEAVTPDFVAEDDDVCARMHVVGAESAAQDWPEAEEREQICVDVGAVETIGLAVDDHFFGGEGIGGDVGESF